MIELPSGKVESWHPLDRLRLLTRTMSDASFNSMDLSPSTDLVALTKLGLSVRIEGLAHDAAYVAKATRIYHDLLSGAFSGHERQPSGTLIDELEQLSIQGTTKRHLHRGV